MHITESCLVQQSLSVHILLLREFIEAFQMHSDLALRIGNFLSIIKHYWHKWQCTGASWEHGAGRGIVSKRTLVFIFAKSLPFCHWAEYKSRQKEVSCQSLWLNLVDSNGVRWCADGVNWSRLSMFRWSPMSWRIQ